MATGVDESLLYESNKLSKILAEHKDRLIDSWVRQLHTEKLPHYEKISDAKLHEELSPTVEQMLAALKTGDPGRVRGHTLGIITLRIQQGFDLPEIEKGLHGLSFAVKNVINDIITDVNYKLIALDLVNELYYNVALIVAEVHQKLQSEQQKRFMAVYELGISMSSSLRLDAVLDTAAKKVAESMHAMAVGITIDNHHSGKPLIRTSRPLPSDLLSVLPDICRETGCRGKVTDGISNYFIFYKDIRNSDIPAMWKDTLVSAGFISLACTPLLYRDQIYGGVIICFPYPRNFPDFEKEFMWAFSTSISIAIQNARLFEEEKRGRQELGLLLDISKTIAATLDVNEVLRRMVKLTVEAVGADYSIVLLPEEDSNRLHIIAHYARNRSGKRALRYGLRIIEPEGLDMNYGESGVVYRTGLPICINDYSQSKYIRPEFLDYIGSMIIVPLIIRGKVSGLFMVLSLSKNAFTEEDMKLSSGVADHAVTALENARLFEESQGKHKLSLLLDAGRLFTSTLDLDEILQKMVQLAVDHLHADSSFILMPDDSGEYLMIRAVHSRDEHFKENISAARNIFESNKIDAGIGGPGQVFRTGETLIISDYSVFPLRVEEMVDVIGSALLMPLKFRDKIFGVFALMSFKTHTFNNKDSELVKAIADQAAVAIENAKLYSHQRNIAETLQKSFLPSVLPDIQGYELAVRYKAAMLEAEVGGDFYDVFLTLDGRLSIVIADVSGKGLAAAVQTAMGKYTLRAYAADNSSMAAAMVKSNKVLFRYLPHSMFVTIFFGQLDINQNILRYIDAGHDPPMHYPANENKLSYLHTTGPALGVMNNTEFQEDQVNINPGDVFLLYTDGATDVRRDGVFLGTRGLEQLFLSSVNLSADEIAESIMNNILQFSSGLIADDIALIVLKRKPDGWI